MWMGVRIFIHAHSGHMLVEARDSSHSLCAVCLVFLRQSLFLGLKLANLTSVTREPLCLRVSVVVKRSHDTTIPKKENI